MKTNAIAMRAGALAALLAFLSSYCAAQITKKDTGYLFRAKFTKGETRKYNMVSAIQIGGVARNVLAPFKQHVNSVRNGVADIAFTLGPMTMGGTAVGSVQKVRSKVDSRGNVASSSATGSVQQLGLVSFPANAIPLGGTWKTSFDASAMAQPMHVQATFKLLRVGAYGSKQAAFLNVKLKNTQSFPIDGEGVYVVSMADGSLIKSDMKMLLTLAVQTSEDNSKAPQKYRVRVTTERK